MKLGLRTSIASALIFVITALLSAQTPPQVGNVYVGICDGVPSNTQQNEIDTYDATGQFVAAFRGPSQNSCLTGMTFDAADHLHVISARFGTQSWKLLEFDNLGDLLSSQGPFNSPTSVTHDQQNNLYLAQGSILKIDPAGNTTTYRVEGDAEWIDLGPDQRTIFYCAANGNVKSFDIVSGMQGPDVAIDALARNVRALPDGSILTDTLGAIRHWVAPCPGCFPYTQAFAYQIPANADSFALDPDGVSFWTINTYYDSRRQLGKADVYQTNIKTREPMRGFSLQPLTNGRYYSTSIGVNGDGMNSTAITKSSVNFRAQLLGTTSNPKGAKISNTGPAQIMVSKLVITGDFAINGPGCLKGVPPGSSCNISITFTPTQTGTRRGTLTIFDTVNNSPQTVMLSGDGTVVSISPTELSFGDEPVGTTTDPKNAILTNVGSTELNFASINITEARAGDFSQTNTCGAGIAGGASCTITVTFKPTAKGSRNAAVSISDDGGGSPQKITLTGTGS